MRSFSICDMHSLWVTSTRLRPGTLCANASRNIVPRQLTSQSSFALTLLNMKPAVCAVRVIGLL
ncbi:hypothetical protein D3C73_1286660 [compost metagenome]